MDEDCYKLFEEGGELVMYLPTKDIEAFWANYWQEKSQEIAENIDREIMDIITLKGR